MNVDSESFCAKHVLLNPEFKVCELPVLARCRYYAEEDQSFGQFFSHLGELAALDCSPDCAFTRFVHTVCYIQRDLCVKIETSTATEDIGNVIHLRKCCFHCGTVNEVLLSPALWEYSFSRFLSTCLSHKAESLCSAFCGHSYFTKGRLVFSYSSFSVTFSIERDVVYTLATVPVPALVGCIRDAQCASTLAPCTSDAFSLISYFLSTKRYFSDILEHFATEES